ncbi:class I adenylate-forming enzyme family protein [Shewanella sp. TC10]|uniref:class I adenylate-forming enzyme family protein n=1 Tax=Shewanella sp. TC10 TaxID=1419739 RepID=UPI00129E96DD|nr:fatty acid--CoA ligase family protein [Shewanella sp. TC10]
MSPIYQQFKQVAFEAPSKLALCDGELQLTFAAILEKVDAVAKNILNLCNGSRPRVTLITPDQVDNVCVSLAVAKVGGCCIPMNAHMLPAQLQAACVAVDTNLVIAQQPLLDKLVLKDGIGGVTCSDIYINDLKACHRDYDELISDWLKEDDYLITLSSGSTGKPKPIMISQQVKLQRAMQTWHLYQLDSSDVMLCASPFFHSLGQRLVFVPLLLGASLIHLSAFRPSHWLELVEQYKISFVIAVSSHLYALKHKLLSNAAALNSLHTVVTSSAPIDAEFKSKVFSAIGCDFHEIYGATEIAVATNLAPKDATEKYKTVGIACDDIELKILATNMQPVEQGQTGQIAVRSPLAFSGYYGQSQLTTQAIDEGYFLTGDIGALDSDGFLTYVGRQKDIIISGGINIYPKDIETALLTDSQLNEVAVIGVEDSLLGEVIVAICVTENKANIEAKLRKVANKTLAPFQRPLKYFFPPLLPLTPTGKVSKLLLRKQYGKLNDGWTDMLRVMLYGEIADE